MLDVRGVQFGGWGMERLIGARNKEEAMADVDPRRGMYVLLS